MRSRSIGILPLSVSSLFSLSRSVCVEVVSQKVSSIRAASRVLLIFDERILRKKKMASKRNASSAEVLGYFTKRKRSVMNLREKLTIVDKIRSGMSLAAISREYGVNESTIRSIRCKEEAIREAVLRSTPECSKVTSVVRDEAMGKMERCLIDWVIKMADEKKEVASTVTIREKAREIYQEITKDQENVKPFTASSGWLARFKNRYSRKFPGDTVSGNSRTAEDFRNRILEDIEEKGYKPEQVFAASKMRLNYKQITKHSEVSQLMNEALDKKILKDSSTLLLCANAAGSCKPKPLMVYRSQNPRSMSERDLSSMPVHWRSHAKVLLTADMMWDWFNNCFVPEVEKYLSAINFPFKVLLLFENSLFNACKNLDVAHPSVEIAFLAPNTASLINPFDQGIIKAFKSNYTRVLYSGAFATINAHPEITMIDFWKNITIDSSIDHVGAAWESLSQRTINVCWQKLWPDCISNLEDTSLIDDQVRENVQAILQLAHRIGGEGFDDMQEEDICDILAGCEVEITEEDDVDSKQFGTETEDSRENDKDVSYQHDILRAEYLTAEKLERWASMVEQLSKEIRESDPVVERGLQFQQQLDSAFQPYTKLLADLGEDQSILP